MRIFTISFLFVLLLFPFAIIQARIIHVPADSSAIQGGINGASDRDTVLVARGHYYERINFLGKAILVTSNFIFDNDATTIDSTIIDGNSLVGDTCSVVVFVSGEDSNSVIKGFTIQNGIGTVTTQGEERYGGAIYCYSSSPTISNNTITKNFADQGAIYYLGFSSLTIDGNIITDNSSEAIVSDGYSLTITNNTITYNGGGIVCFYCSFNITNNTIRRNSGSWGGGIGCSFSTGTISNNTITDNSTDQGGGILCTDTGSPPTIISNNIIIGNSAGYVGGGICCLDYSSPIITNNTMSSNSAGYRGGGIYCVNHSSPAITNNIVSSSLDGEGIACSTESFSEPYISYNNAWNNTGGNFSSCDTNLGILDTVNVNGDSCDKFFNISCDPLFADTLYHLLDSSCCMEAGYNGARGLLWFDFDGQPRVMDGDSNGVAIVDIGADEFPGEPPLCGDANGDGLIDVADVVFLINYLFIGGPKPVLLSTGDVNLDGMVNDVDVVYLINYLFIGGPAPCQS